MGFFIAFGGGDNNGQVYYVTDVAGNKTDFTYSSETDRKIAAFNALSKATRYAYDIKGNMTHTWGEATYPVKYDYDSYGCRSQN